MDAFRFGRVAAAALLAGAIAAANANVILP